ncbi:hypothetical protein [Treponema pedis]|uniref:hypothetical protein n=1 Tax=Treponema pedis TaxID=409322 RepID=UPI001268FE96|nr:hypothetical protein [Treponema pedis]
MKTKLCIYSHYNYLFRIANGNVANGTLEVSNSSSGASSTGLNSVDRSSGSSSYGVGSTANVSLASIYDLLAE